MRTEKEVKLFTSIGLAVLISIYCILINQRPEFLLFEAFISIPIILYVYKYNINFYVISLIIAISFIMNPYSFFVFIGFVLVPAIIIGYCMGKKVRLVNTVVYTSVFSFVSIIITIFILRNVYSIDIIQICFDALNNITKTSEDLFIKLYGNQLSSELPYFKQAIEGQVSSIKQNYFSIIYQVCLVITLFKAFFARMFAKAFRWEDCNLKSVLNYNLPRNTIIFLGILILISASGIEISSQLQVAIVNVINIMSFILFGVGVSLQVNNIIRIKSIALRVVISIITVMCFFTVPIYFTVMGVIETLFRFRNKAKTI